MRRGTLPPTLFMRKRKVPMQKDLILAGTISTRTVNTRENQVSAATINQIQSQMF